ncbi:hypothetical protein KUTeg_001138 [Tegillarca granosa]|uniref:Uncharacterized protein n=1 Tax=Tegillarca granosa TaxID=220873 RepID=A0ABQ9FYG0_TEGGR|nr:hypothetical protein KUTeg_001138 [Tegillarca granosa]
MVRNIKQVTNPLLGVSNTENYFKTAHNNVIGSQQHGEHLQQYPQRWNAWRSNAHWNGWRTRGYNTNRNHRKTHILTTTNLHSDEEINQMTDNWNKYANHTNDNSRQHSNPQHLDLNQGPSNPLSNFFPCKLQLFDLNFYSAEHLYQYWKQMKSSMQMKMHLKPKTYQKLLRAMNNGLRKR